MRKITVLISGSKETMLLQQSIVDIDCLSVSRATIFWMYENITEISYYSSGVTTTYLTPGYYTFGDLSDVLRGGGAILEASKVDGKCTLSTEGLFYMDAKTQNMLGFPGGGIFATKGTVKGTNRVDMNHGLRYVKVRCDLADDGSSTNEKGTNDSILLTLPVTSKQSLFGSVQEFTHTNSKVQTNGNIINRLNFTVTDQDDKPINVGSILLDLYLL